MKNTYLLMLLYISLYTQFGLACDVCNAYIAPGLSNQQNSVGLVYRYRKMMGEYSPFGTQLQTKHAAHGNDPFFWSKQVIENYNTIELQGKFLWKERFISSFVLPYSINNQLVNNTLRYTVSGFGDPLILQEVILLNRNFHSDTSKIFLTFGTGFKVPLGATDKMINEEIPNLDLQPGSGSFDVLLVSNYQLLLRGVFIQGLSSFRINGKNEEAYQYGNAFNQTLNFGYKFNLKNTALLPYFGGYFEQASFDKSDIVHEDTGGKTYYLQGGVRFLYASKMEFFAEYQPSLKTNLNGYQQLITDFRGNIGIKFLW